MTVKIGQAKIVGSVGADSIRTQILNVVEKIEGTYIETLVELYSMEVVMGTEIMDSASEVGQGYRVYPCVAAADKILDYKYTASDIITWPVPLAEVV